MKKLISVILCLLLLAGCSIGIGPFGDRNSAGTTVSLPSENEVSASFDIYPDNSPFSVTGRFERTDYPHLNNRQKAIYRALDDAVYKMQTGYISVGSCTTSDIDLVYHALRNDRPEYFWLPNTYLIKSSEQNTEICFAKTEADWPCSKAERSKAEKNIKILLTGFVSSLDNDLSEYELELKAHDWLTERVSYDKNAMASPKNNHCAWNIDGAFLNSLAVCEGYSRAMQVLLFSVGIECGIVVGETNEAHMWNTVKIDGKWYHLDATHNDAGAEPYHFFFNVSTEYLLRSRTIDPTADKLTSTSERLGRFNVFLPSCTSNDMNYHIVNNLYIGSLSQVESTVVSTICQAVRSKANSVELAVSPDIGFVFGQTDAAEFFDLQRCISAANAELSRSQQIRSYSYGGIDGVLGFVVSW